MEARPDADDTVYNAYARGVRDGRYLAGRGAGPQGAVIEAAGWFEGLPLVARIAVWVLALDAIAIGGAFLLGAAWVIGLLFFG